MLKKILYCIFILISFGSCTTTSILSSVDSYGRHPEPGARNYFIETINPGVDQKIPESEEYPNLLEKLLEKHGYDRVDNPKDADIFVLLSYGSKKINYSFLSFEPIQSPPIVVSRTVGPDGEVSRTYGPRNQIDYAPATREGRSFHKEVRIAAYKNTPVASSGDLQIHWQMNIVSEGRNSDFHQVFPFMLAAAYPYIGRSSFDEKVIEIKEDNPLLQSLLSSEEESDTATNKEALEEALP